jgi:hypothetical protein
VPIAPQPPQRPARADIMGDPLNIYPRGETGFMINTQLDAERQVRFFLLPARFLIEHTVISAQNPVCGLLSYMSTGGRGPGQHCHPSCPPGQRQHWLEADPMVVPSEEGGTGRGTKRSARFL